MVKSTQKSDLPWSAIFSVIIYHRYSRNRYLLKCVQRKLDIAGTAIEMHLLLLQLIKCPFQITVPHFDQNRTIKYQPQRWF